MGSKASHEAKPHKFKLNNGTFYGLVKTASLNCLLQLSELSEQKSWVVKSYLNKLRQSNKLKHYNMATRATKISQKHRHKSNIQQATSL